MKLYHGTDRSSAMNIIMKGIDLSKGNENLDFGKGFYTTPDLYKAEKRALMKAKQNVKEAYIVTMVVSDEKMNPLNIKVFKNADVEWGRFILNNRSGVEIVSENGFINHNLDNRYDIVIGQIADGNVSTLAYKMRMRQISAEDISYREFLPERGALYGRQVSFHTQRSLSCITSIECGKIKNIKKKGSEQYGSKKY